MKTEELLRYREIYQALRARFGVRFVEFGFRAREQPLTHGRPKGEKDPHPFDVGSAQSGSESVKGL